MRLESVQQAKERWVEANCGQLSNVVVAGTPAKPAPACSTVGEADGYVFAVSWQPAFCASHADKLECQGGNNASWAARNFTLHGLWPNKASCGTTYGFCSSQLKAKAFCDYPAPALSEETFKALSQVMPSAHYGSCLERHEWYKHGTCQNKWNADGYYTVAVDLTKQFDNPTVTGFLGSNLGKSASMQDFLAVVDASLGGGAHQRMQIMCDKAGGKLVDVYMNLPADIPNNPNLAELLAKAPTGFRNTCGDSFVIDTFAR